MIRGARTARRGASPMMASARAKCSRARATMGAQAWPWQLTPLTAQATGAWLISLGVAAGQALAERDARRLRPRHFKTT